ncbi:hypothetical protein CN445_25335 [Bacillus cereus]|nr:hypothetical protein CN507_05715 [Bacillus cereus]PEW83442.1 hypothetical protein CN445_25335 [Bacillus cereus]PFN77795.1 hypothetical protein COJ62_06635 [Bacillus cereus]GCF74962.1 hypothetical protein BC2926_25030 [Bacillus cereus]
MRSEKKRGNTMTLGGIILGGAALFGFLNDGTDFIGKVLDKNPFKETQQQQSEVIAKTKKFSKTEINEFMSRYNRASVHALNNSANVRVLNDNDLDEVKGYLTSKGSFQAAQLQEIDENYTNKTTKELLKSEVTEVEVKNPNEYVVYTYEEYDIYNHGKKKPADKGEHKYTLIVDENNKLKVSDHKPL